MKFRIFLLLTFISIISAKSAKKTVVPEDIKLELVQVLFRHGERTPTDLEYATLPYFNTSVYEPYGIGQLTNNGKEQMYNVGLKLRERYDEYLNVKYLPEEVYAYSSEDDRTKMSLQLVLAGLFPPAPGLVWNPDLEWIPLPFRYTPKEVDVLMKPYSSKAFRKISTEVRRQPDYVKAISKYSHTFDLIRNVTGRFITYDFPDVIIGVHNILVIHERFGLPLPYWYTENVKNDLRSSVAIILKSEGKTIKQRRMNGGSMVRTFMQNMNLNGNLDNPRKIYLYSGHDFTLNGFFHAFEIYNYGIIDFGTTLIFEKFRDSKDEVYVRLLAYTPIDKKLVSLRFGKCEEFCPVNDYLKHIFNVIPNDEEMNVLFNEFNVEKLKELFFADNNVKERKS